MNARDLHPAGGNDAIGRLLELGALYVAADHTAFDTIDPHDSAAARRIYKNEDTNP